MKYFYDASKAGFLVEGLHEIPAAAVEISAARWAELMDGQATGQMIAADESGAPILIDRPAPVPAWDEVRASRNQKISDVEWLISRHAGELGLVDSGDLSATTLTEAQILEVQRYIQSLREVPNSFSAPDAVIWPVKPVLA